MGAQAKVEGNSATIEGIEKFSGARVSAPDLRAGAALCIAGLAADGITIVDDIVYILHYTISRRKRLYLLYELFVNELETNS